MIQHTSMQNQSDYVNAVGMDHSTMLSVYFSLNNIVGSCQKFMDQETDEVKDVEPAINLMVLGEMFKMMQKDFDINFSNTLIFPTVPMNFVKERSPAVITKEGKISYMGGVTLGDLLWTHIYQINPVPVLFHIIGRYKVRSQERIDFTSA